MHQITNTTKNQAICGCLVGGFGMQILFLNGKYYETYAESQIPGKIVNAITIGDDNMNGLDNIMLFGRKTSLGISDWLLASLKMFNAQIFYNGEMMFFGVPALDPTGIPCMYDSVTKQPFYNSGTGEFGYELLNGTYVAPV